MSKITPIRFDTNLVNEMGLALDKDARDELREMIDNHTGLNVIDVSDFDATTILGDDFEGPYTIDDIRVWDTSEDGKDVVRLVLMVADNGVSDKKDWPNRVVIEKVEDGESKTWSFINDSYEHSLRIGAQAHLTTLIERQQIMAANVAAMTADILACRDLI